MTDSTDFTNTTGVQVDEHELTISGTFIYYVHLAKHLQKKYDLPSKQFLIDEADMTKKDPEEKDNPMLGMGLGTPQYQQTFFEGVEAEINCYPDVGEYVFQYKDQEIRMVILIIDPNSEYGVKMSPYAQLINPLARKRAMRFYGNIDLIKEFIGENINEILKEWENDKKLTVYINENRETAGMFYQGFSQMSGWSMAKPVDKRSIDTIFLPHERKETLFGDIEEFLSPEMVEWYEKHNILQKRSYLFWGPPGTGKTSTARAIASKFNLKIFNLKLSSGLTDDMLVGMMGEIPEKSMLLIEDIDRFFNIEHEEEKRMHGKRMAYENFEMARGGHRLTFSGFLNAIDGLNTINKSIIVMTTNNRDLLNEQLTRSGRIDHEVYFPTMTKEQIRMMTTSFYPEAVGEPMDRFVIKLEKLEITPATLQEMFIRYKKYTDESLLDRIVVHLKQIKREGGEGACISAAAAPQGMPVQMMTGAMYHPGMMQQMGHRGFAGYSYM